MELSSKEFPASPRPKEASRASPGASGSAPGEGAGGATAETAEAPALGLEGLRLMPMAADPAPAMPNDEACPCASTLAPRMPRGRLMPRRVWLEASGLFRGGLEGLEVNFNIACSSSSWSSSLLPSAFSSLSERSFFHGAAFAGARVGGASAALATARLPPTPSSSSLEVSPNMARICTAVASAAEAAAVPSAPAPGLAVAP
mmetsp:Transcript_62043/g.136500  ORF Transcript_62043/g.136500 Transcript_62043/m.136500 type:complete len:202 (-) Transcript_62043:35-640(-)